MEDTEVIYHAQEINDRLKMARIQLADGPGANIESIMCLLDEAAEQNLKMAANAGYVPPPPVNIVDEEWAQAIRGSWYR